MAIPNLQSFRETLKTSFVKPDSSLLDGFKQSLMSNQLALDYLKINRNLSESTIRHFQLGYSEEKNAIVIPIFKNKELINLRYRFIDPEAKPKYSQTSGCEVWVFNEEGFDLAKERGSLLITEGEFDSMSCWQAGFRAVISPASGKDSYGTWLEQVDTIPKVYIAYDNDKPGKTASKKFADRVGVDKCFEVDYAPDVKDANEYFQKYTAKDFFGNIKQARPFYKYQFSGISDVITDLRESKAKSFFLDCAPMIDWTDTWQVIVSGRSNCGKSSYVLNIASELASKDIPTLILPFERGITQAGKRLLQVRHGIQKHEFSFKTDNEWEAILEDSMHLPLYFARPDELGFIETVRKAKRFFGIQYCIFDHLDYYVHGDNKYSKQADLVQVIEDLAQELDIKFIVVHHINKQDTSGFKEKKLTMENLSGASEIYKIPEAVILLQQSEGDITEYILDKNKGETGSSFFVFTPATGKFIPTVPDAVKEKKALDDAFNNF